MYRRVLIAICLMFVFGSACVPNSAVTHTVTPIVISSPIPSADPTSTLSSAPTVTPWIDAEREAVLNQQLQDFLNKEGDFTTEETSSMMMTFFENDKLESIGLGVCDSHPIIQGYLFDYIELQDVILLIVGFDGADGNRFVTPVEIPVYMYEAVKDKAEKDTSFVFRVDALLQNSLDDLYFIGLSNTKYLSDRSDFTLLFESIKHKVVGISLSIWPLDYSYIAEHYGPEAGLYVNESNSKINLSYRLLESVTSNNFTYEIPEGIETANVEIMKLTSTEDLNNLDISMIPLVDSICFFGG